MWPFPHTGTLSSLKDRGLRLPFQRSGAGPARAQHGAAGRRKKPAFTSTSSREGLSSQCSQHNATDSKEAKQRGGWR